MKSGTKVALVLLAIACMAGVAVGSFLLGGSLTAYSMAKSKGLAGSGPKQTRPLPARDTGPIDLGDGITLEESASKSKDGKVKRRLTTIARDGQQVMTIVRTKSSDTPSGQRLGKNYWRDGRLWLSEADNNGDGFFELVVLWDQSGPVQAFDQAADGGIVPVSTSRLKSLQDMCELMHGDFAPVAEGANKGVTKEERHTRIEKTIKKTDKKAKAEETD